MTRYQKFVLIGRLVFISATLFCMFVGALFPPLHMLGGIPVAGTLLLLVPWDRYARRREVRRERKRKAKLRAMRRAEALPSEAAAVQPRPAMSGAVTAAVG